MNQKAAVMDSTQQQNQTLILQGRSRLAKYFLFKAFEHAQQGHLIVRERGAVVAEFGQPGDALMAEVNILDQRFYARMLFGGSSGAGESYVDGWWQTTDITNVVRFFARNLSTLDVLASRFGWALKPIALMRKLSRLNTKSQAKKNILAHYDLGNELYKTFLDSRMQYSSAIFSTSDELLAQAQVNKMKRACEQLCLTEDDHLLEIGSGWCGLAIYAAQHYGCKVTTTTISDEQYAYGQQAIAEAGLEDKIELLNCDYRELQGQYDKLVSIEMVEAVGQKFLPVFFEKVNQLLKPNGLFMIQAITIADQRYDNYCSGEDFIQKHIFPGGFLPSITVLSETITEKTDMVIRNVFDMGLDYAETLVHWRNNLLDNRKALAGFGYDERFMKLWSYYFGYCEGGFLERRISAVQILSSKAPHL